MTLTETANAIATHLIRFSRTPSSASKTWIDSAGTERELTLFWYPVCYRAGPRVKVKYVSYQYESSLTKAEAEQYLAWLDAGNVGRHYDAKKAAYAEGVA